MLKWIAALTLLTSPVFGQGGTLLNSYVVGAGGGGGGGDNCSPTCVAALFVAANDEYLSHADDPALDLGAGDFSIEVWINANSYPANRNGIIAKFDGSVEWTLREQSDAIVARMDDGVAVANNHVGQPITTDANYQVIWVVERTGGTSTLYLDNDAGNVDTSIPSGSLDNAGEFAVGRGENDATKDFDGAIHHLRIWIGTALSAAQRSYLWNSGVPLDYSELSIPGSVPAPSHAWDLGEASGARTAGVGGKNLTDNNTVLSETLAFP